MCAEQKNIGKKGKARKQFKIDGKTGKSLIKYVYDDIRSHKEELKKYVKEYGSYE